MQQEGQPDLLAEFVDMFLTDAPTRLDDLREAAAKGDADTVEGVAHTLKGSSQHMGAPRMAALCKQLQEAALSQNLTGVPKLIDELTGELERVGRALNEEAAVTESPGDREAP